MPTLTGKARAISNAVQDVAAHLDGLANDGFGWTKPEAEAERRRFREALRTNADALRAAAKLIGD